MDGRGGGEEDAFALAARLGLPAATAAASRGPPPPTAAALEERFRRLQDDLMRRRVEKLKPPPTAPVTDEELRLRFQRLTQSNTPNGAFTQSSAAPSSSVHAPPLPLPPTPMDAESLMRSLAPAAGPRAPLPVGPGHPPRSAVADANAAFNEDAAVRRLLEQTRDSITIQRRPDCGPRSPAAAQGSLDQVIAQVLASRDDSDEDVPVDVGASSSSSTPSSSSDDLTDPKRKRGKRKATGPRQRTGR